MYLLRYREIYLSLKYTFLILFDSYKLLISDFCFLFSTLFPYSLLASCTLFITAARNKKEMGKGTTEILYIVVFKETRQT